MLYYEDPYLKEAEVEIVKKENNRYLLSDTILYPGGGGQPPDVGYAICGDKRLKIMHLGNLWHEIEGDCNARKIKIEIDWSRRYWFMRAHTAEHAFFRFLQDKGATLGRANFGEESSLVFRGDISLEDILEAEEKTRKLIKDGREVGVFWISKEEVKKYPQLRIRLDRIRENRIRVVKIEGHDISACKGTHVRNLSEIGDFCITHVRLGSVKEVKFVVGDLATQTHYSFSQKLRSISWRYNVTPEKMEKYVENLLEEREKLYNALKDASEKLPFEEEKCREIKLYWLLFYGSNRKILVKRIMELVKEEKSIAVFGDLSSQTIMCAFSKDLHLGDRILSILREQGGKGGGKGNFINGKISPEEFIKKMREELCTS